MLRWRGSSGQTPACCESCDSEVANQISFVHIILITSGVLASDRIDLDSFSWAVYTDRVAETIKAEVGARGLAVFLSM